jgi:hypothetical protein
MRLKHRSGHVHVQPDRQIGRNHDPPRSIDAILMNHKDQQGTAARLSVT